MRPYTSLNFLIEEYAHEEDSLAFHFVSTILSRLDFLYRRERVRAVLDPFQAAAGYDVVSFSPLDSLPTYEGRAVLGRSRGCLDFFVVLFSLR